MSGEVIAGMVTQALVFLGLLLNFFQSRKNNVDIGKTHALVNSQMDAFKAEQRKLLDEAVIRATVSGHAAGKAEAQQAISEDAAKKLETDQAAAALVEATQKAFAAGKAEGESNHAKPAGNGAPVPVSLEEVSQKVAEDIGNAIKTKPP